MSSSLITLSAIAGLTGVGLVIVGVLISALAFRGFRGERYDLRNHFISELGEVGISRAAWAFNGALIASGLVLVVFMVGAGAYTRHWLGYIAGGAGVLSALACAAVGIFPMNRLSAHGKAAILFFNIGQISMLLFAAYLLFVRNARVPQALLIPAALSALAFVAFLRTPFTADSKDAFGENRGSFVPPRWWINAILEWMVLITVEAWIVCYAIIMLR